MANPYEDLLVEASFECRYVELADNTLETKTLQLAPVYLFGDDVKVLALDENEDNELHPEYAVAKFRMNAVTYTTMIRYQQGSETAGDDPPPWALIEGSAAEVESGRVLETGEVYPIFG